MWQYMNNPGASRGLTSALSELLKREWLYTPGWRRGYSNLALSERNKSNRFSNC
jgi:hypothetical protein